jgi:cytochrome c peroxidase
LIEEYKQGQNFALIIDEAHDIPLQTLEYLLIMANIQDVTKNLIQVVLVGTHGLKQKLKHPILRQLKKDYTIYTTLSPLKERESIAYIQHRLSKAAISEAPLFTKGALKRIAAYAQGNPRILNSLCADALILVALSQQKSVSAKIVRKVIANFAAKRHLSLWRWACAGAAGVLLLLGFMPVVPYTRLVGSGIGKLELSRLTGSLLPLHKEAPPTDTLLPAAQQEPVLSLHQTAVDTAPAPAVSSPPIAAIAVPIPPRLDAPATREEDALLLQASLVEEASISALPIPLSTTPAESPAEIGPLPPLPIPEDNPLTPEKVELGKRLFFDPRLSGDGSLACVSCHLPDQGWTINTPLSPAYPTNMERRNSQTLINVAYNKALTWDGRAEILEKLSLGPIQNPLHMNQNLDLLIEKLKAISAYEERFRQVFGTTVTPEALGKALAAFERTLVSRNSPFDRYMTGDWQAMSKGALRGMALFKDKARCILCHNGPNFTDSQFHRLGVPDAPLLSDPLVQAAIRFDAKRMNVPEYQSVKDDLGRYLVTKEEKDRGAFKTPTLRNAAQREPYMHNGVFQSLEEVINFYDGGGGAIAGKSPHLQALGLTAQEKHDLLDFLLALTGELPSVTPPDLTR